MRIMLISIALVLAACGESSKEPSVAEDMHTAADELQESIESSMEKAANVEDELQDAAEELDAAIEEAAGDQ